MGNSNDPIGLSHDDPISSAMSHLDGHGFDVNMAPEVGPDDFESMIDGLTEDQKFTTTHLKMKTKKPSQKANPVAIRRKLNDLGPGSDDEDEGNTSGKVGAYSPESRKARIARFLEKRKQRVWKQPVKYNVRKDFANSRLR